VFGIQSVAVDPVSIVDGKLCDPVTLKIAIADYLANVERPRLRKSGQSSSCEIAPISQP